MSSLTTYNLIQKEAKTFTFTIKDSDGNIIDVSNATCYLYGKTSLGATTYLFQKTDSDFDKSQGSNGIITVTLDSDDLDFYGYAYCILKLQISSGDTDKYIFKLNLERSIE
jgi:hypothetical protein